MAKHVIILGAGASYSSGYPLAAGLRVLLSGPEALEGYLAAKLQHKRWTKRLKDEFTMRAKTLRLFQKGSFGTVDEFSNLACGSFPEEVQDLKWWLSLVFGVHNPAFSYATPGSKTGETTTGFEHSDYFAFVRKLFKDSVDLRDDIAVFTYNYDAYLDFILCHAFMARKEVVTGKPIKLTQIPSAVLSGLHNGDSDDLLKRTGFCYLKLHGTSVLPAFQNKALKPGALTFNEAFGNRDQLIARLNSKTGSKSPSGQAHGTILTPPIFFPWEILSDKGGFVSERDFRRVEGVTSTGAFACGAGKKPSYYSLFRAVWERAQQETTDAEKISFVGFSAHEFMKGGLQFLLKKRAQAIKAGTSRPLKVVTANPDSVPKGSYGIPPLPNAHVDGLKRLLNAACPKLPLGNVVCYPDFGSFIRAEL